MARTREDEKNIGGPEDEIDAGDAEIAARAGDAVTRGDADKDRQKLFPEAQSKSRPQESIPPPKGG